MPFYEQGYLIVQDGLHYEELTVGTTVTGPAEAPAGTRRAMVQVTFAPIRWLALASKGLHPTGSFGLELDDGDYFVYDGPPSDLEFIRDSAATQNAIVRIHYFGV